MIRISCFIAAALLFLSAGVGPLQSQEIKAGDLVIEQPWSRATPSGAKVGAGYLKITNRGSSPDRLVGGSTAGAARIEIHEMRMTDGVMTMRPLPGGLTIEPGKSVQLAPGGFHIMFVDIKEPLKQGGKLRATLEFEKAGKVEVTFDIGAVGAQGPGGGMPAHRM